MYISPQEAADMLGYTRQHVYRLIESGRIAASRPSGKRSGALRINRAWLLGYMERSSVRPKQTPKPASKSRKQALPGHEPYDGTKDWLKRQLTARGLRA